LFLLIDAVIVPRGLDVVPDPDAVQTPLALVGIAVVVCSRRVMNRNALRREATRDRRLVSARARTR